jgi:hypothetical protein
MTLAEMANVAVFIAPACHVSSPRPTQIIRSALVARGTAWCQ